MNLAMQCNICGGDQWGDFSLRKGIRCLKCGSLERTRLFWLFFETLEFSSEARVLHVAPEKALYTRMKDHFGNNYFVADIDPTRYSFATDCRYIDFTSLDNWPSNTYDLIIHIHVLEHVPCNIAYTLFHLHRMLTDEGTHLFIIPFSPGNYDECFADIGKEERNRRFGQYDHVRSFGEGDLEKHLGKLLNLPGDFDALNSFPEERLRACNIPQSFWKGFHGATVLNLKKSDYRLQ